MVAYGGPCQIQGGDNGGTSQLPVPGLDRLQDLQSVAVSQGLGYLFELLEIQGAGLYIDKCKYMDR